MTYSDLNDAVHAAADVFEKAGLEVSSNDRFLMNDYLTNYLNDRGDVEMVDDVRCQFCGKHVPSETAHRHDGAWVGECCWDERLRSTE